MTGKTLTEIMKNADFGKFTEDYNRLMSSSYKTAFLNALHTLKRDKLYQSAIHGEGHIERVLLFGAFLAKDCKLDDTDTALLLEACSYHDVGRIDDSKDDEHGARSALKMQELTGRTGVELDILCAAVTAHSPNDDHMHAILSSYHLGDSPRAKQIACLLKDADALDRVRVTALDPAYLRYACSQHYVEFSYLLYRLFSTVTVAE